MMRGGSAFIHQSHRLRAGGRVGYAFDPQRLFDECGAPGVVAGAQTHLVCGLEVASQHLDQQDISLMSRLRTGSPVEPFHFAQRLLRPAVEDVGKGEVAAAIGVAMGKSPRFGQGANGLRNMSELRFGDAQTGECLSGLQVCGSAFQQGLGPLRKAQAQLGGTKAEQALGVFRLKRERLLVGLFRRLLVAAVEPNRAEPVPGIRCCLRGLCGSQVERGRRGAVAALLDIARQLHQPRVVAFAAQGGGRATRQQDDGAEQTKSTGAGQGQNSSGRWLGLPHSIGGRLRRGVRRLRNLVVIGGEWLSIGALTQDSRRNAAACLLSLGLPLVAAAEVQPEWADRPYAYVVIAQDVRSVLEAFGRNLGVPMAISAKVRGQAQANLRADTAGEFLEKLASSSGLTWFSDGSRIHVNTEEELQLRQFDLDRAAVQALQASLDALGVTGRHLALRSNAEGDGVMVSGPPEFMAMVQQQLEQQRPPASQPEPVRERGVKVFRGSAGPQWVSEAGTQ